MHPACPYVKLFPYHSHSVDVYIGQYALYDECQNLLELI